MTTPTERPKPLIAPEVDLRDYEYFPLYFDTLFSSDTWSNWDDRQRVVGLRLWCKSWHQEPAGSLPDVDKTLAQLAGYGDAPESVRAWKRLRPAVLEGGGWVLCNDGRWYHPIICQIAAKAWGAKRRKVAENEAEAARKRAKRARTKGQDPADKNKDAKPDTPAASAPVSAGQTPNVPPDKRTVEVEEEREDGRKESPTTSPDAAREDPVEVVVDGFLSLRSKLWPSESRLPAPTLTLKTQAKQYLDAGAPPELILEVFERVMRQKLEKPESAPTDLRFCRLTLESETGRYLTDIPAFLDRTGGGGGRASLAPRALPSAEKTAYQRAVDAWIAGGCKGPRPQPSDHAGAA